MKYNKVRNVHTDCESIITEKVYKVYQPEFVLLVEDCDTETGKKKVIKKTKKSK